MDSIDHIFENPEKLRFEEKALLFCMLKAPSLVKSNRKLIGDHMFSDHFNSLLYKSMVEVQERGARTFKPKDLASRIVEYDHSIGKSTEIATQIQHLLSSDKEPPFYKTAYRFWENWRKRNVNRRFKEAMSAPIEEGDSSDYFDRLEEVLKLRQKPNPFAGSCKSAKEVLHKTLDMLHRIWDGNYIFPKIATGYRDFDELIDGGFDEGSLVIMGGATGHGKSAAALNMAISMAMNNIGVAYISLEESERDLALKVITSQTGITRRNLINKDLITEDEQKMAGEVMEKFVNDESILQITCGGKTAGDIISLIRTHHEKDDTKVFIVDYAQRITLERDNTTAEIARFALGLGELARELGLVIIATSQLKREGRKDMAKRKPTTYDLSESSYLENEAAYIVTLYRQELVPGIEERDDYDPNDNGTLEMIVCKQRNGAQGSAKLMFDGPSVRLTSRNHGATNQASAFDNHPAEADAF